MANGDYSEGFLQARLMDHYYNERKYFFHNMYFFSEDGEQDAVHFLENGLCYEYEIKTRKFDFMDDFKKVNKHKKLKEAFLNKDKTKSFDTANRFYYACPPGIIDKKDVPTYAGLVEVDEHKVRIVKTAPVLHRHLWNPVQYFDRIYKKWIKYVRGDFEKVLEKHNAKFLKRSAYKRKKYTPKPKHPPESKFLGIGGDDLS